MNRAVNYLEGIADRLGKPAVRLGMIDRALAEAGMRRKGVGRTVPDPSLKEEIALLLAANSAAAPLAWARTSKEPKLSDVAEEARKWLNLPLRYHRGKHASRLARATLGETLAAAINQFWSEEPEIWRTLSVELNLTTESATIDFPGPLGTDFAEFAGVDCGKVTDAETIVRIRGLYLEHLAIGRSPDANA